jgi:hypothetical protein
MTPRSSDAFFVFGATGDVASAQPFCDRNRPDEEKP